MLGEIDGQSVIDITTTKGNIFVNGKVCHIVRYAFNNQPKLRTIQ
jgi:DUF4097 and DUF4098 domain-containing protein YvlB